MTPDDHIPGRKRLSGVGGKRKHSDAQIEQMRADKAAGMTHRQIALKYGVSYPHVSKLLTRNTAGCSLADFALPKGGE
jgi:transposase